MDSHQFHHKAMKRAFSIRALIPPIAPRQTRIQPRRWYAIQTPGAPVAEIFDPRTKWMQKERAAKDVEASRRVDYLKDEVAFRLCERLLVCPLDSSIRERVYKKPYANTVQDIQRHFPNVLDLGANACNIGRILTQPPPQDSPIPIDGALKNRIGNLLCAESSPSLLYRDEHEPFNSEVNITRQVLASDETLPFEPNTFDAVLSSLSLHWINDLPSVLAQINHILKPDAPFLGVMLGGDTLYELRTSLQLADLERRGGVSTHTSPLADVRDVGGLLQKADFNLLTVDVDDIIIDYPDIFALMQDLQAMGESNAVLGREAGAVRREVLAAGDAIYKQLHGNEDGTIPATFRLIYMIGWKRSPTQAKPLERGTGMFSIKDILEKQGGNIKGGDGEGDGKK